MSLPAAIFIAVLASVLYHIFIKTIPAGVSPLLGLGVAYLVSAALCFLLLPLFPPEGGIATGLRALNWTVPALAVAIVGIEAGYLLAYRAGWDISLGALVGNVIVALVLLPVGRFVFSERLSLSQAAGVVLCIAGLLLLKGK